MVQDGHQNAQTNAQRVLRAMGSSNAHQEVRTKAHKDQKYLKTCGITIDEDAKMQFYTEQMIDSGMYEKKDVIEW